MREVNGNKQEEAGSQKGKAKRKQGGKKHFLCQESNYDTPPRRERKKELLDDGKTGAHRYYELLATPTT